MAKRGKAAEEAKPDQGEFVSRWRLTGQRMKELASFLLARECLSLPVAPYSSPVVAVGPSLKSFPPFGWGWRVTLIHPQAGRAVLQGSVALEEEEK